MKRGNTTKEAKMIGGAPLLDTDELSQLTGIVPATLAAWRVRGRGPSFVRLGRRYVRYRRDDVQSWLDAHVIVPSGERDDQKAAT